MLIREDNPAMDFAEMKDAIGALLVGAGLMQTCQAAWREYHRLLRTGGYDQPVEDVAEQVLRNPLFTALGLFLLLLVLWIWSEGSIGSQPALRPVGAGPRPPGR